MAKIYNDAVDKNVATTVIFYHNSKFYYDEGFENEVPADDMKNLYLKGVVACNVESESFVSPAGFDGEEGTIAWSTPLT